MKWSDRFGYPQLKEEVAKRDPQAIKEILELRSQDLGMHTIAKTLIDRHVSYRIPEGDKRIDDLAFGEGGIYDILLPKPKDGYDLDGLRNLATAVIGCAVEDYGYSLSHNMSNEHPASEKFFTSGLCDVYLGVFDVPMTGKDVMDEVKNRVANGARWR
jgi:hypothetical protein